MGIAQIAGRSFATDIRISQAMVHGSIDAMLSAATTEEGRLVLNFVAKIGV